MADDKHFVGGQNYCLDDFSGFKIRNTQGRMQWDNVFTKPPHWSPRQPQDLTQGVRDDQTVAIARPRQKNQFTIVGTYVTEPSTAGATSITVASTVGFNVGDLCQVVLDNGNPFQFVLASYAGNVLSWTGAGLPGTVGTSFGSPIENAVTDFTSVGGT